ncbi:hypothetical protein B0H16DRAFT_1451893 [Mycena metata]|uniref:Uncharacterized protein n=1 Tax=Mycena metata TaxID=1033252 RepID=A0AAD7NPL3_9AGAR|nr:hypothetical protein B0H16DRAFT_1451893 [Mycena metata]
MTDLSALAPAASPVGGAGVSPRLHAPLDGLAAAVDTMGAAVASLATVHREQCVPAVSLALCSFHPVPTVIANVTTAYEAVTAAAAQVAAAAASDSASATPHPSGPPAAGPASQPLIRTSGPWIAGFLYAVVPNAPLGAVPDNGEKWFAITRGRYIGLTTNAAIAINATGGVSGGLGPKFSNQMDALEHFNSALSLHAVAVIQG